jgi:hypothetical protein
MFQIGICLVDFQKKEEWQGVILDLCFVEGFSFNTIVKRRLSIFMYQFASHFSSIEFECI